MSCNGSQAVVLNVATQDYLGQFNLNYAPVASGINPFLSEIFSINNDPSSTPMTWPPSGPTTAPSSIYNVLPGTTVSGLVDTMHTSTSPPSLNSSPPLAPSSSLYPVPSSLPPLSQPLQPAEESASPNSGQIAGIAIGVILVILLALAVLGVLLLRRKRQRVTRNNPSYTRDLNDDRQPISFILNRKKYRENKLSGQQWSELSGEEPRAQLHGEGELWELHGETAR